MSDNLSPIVVKTPIKIYVVPTLLFVLPVAVWLAQIFIHRADPLTTLAQTVLMLAVMLFRVRLHERAHAAAYWAKGLPKESVDAHWRRPSVSIKNLRLTQPVMIEVALASLAPMLTLAAAGLVLVSFAFVTPMLSDWAFSIGMALLPSPFTTLGDLFWVAKALPHPTATFVDAGHQMIIYPGSEQ
jgi:hypothetical protein